MCDWLYRQQLDYCDLYSNLKLRCYGAENIASVHVSNVWASYYSSITHASFSLLPMAENTVMSLTIGNIKKTVGKILIQATVSPWRDAPYWSRERRLSSLSIGVVWKGSRRIRLRRRGFWWDVRDRRDPRPEEGCPTSVDPGICGASK